MIIDFFNRGGGGSYTLPKASATVLGGVKVGQNLTIDSGGTLSADAQQYTLPTASANVLGGIKVGNNLSIDANGVLSASGGGDPNAEKVVELTQAEYNALTGYSANTTYVISDAAAIDMDDYATQDDLIILSGNVINVLASKADKRNIANPFTGASYYNSTARFPVWNEQGVITGNDGNNWGAGFSKVNGNYAILMAKDAATFQIFAPTDKGTQNQMLVSNGGGAPVWTTQKIVFCTQSQYDALTTPDSTTLYIITGE